MLTPLSVSCDPVRVVRLVRLSHASRLVRPCPRCSSRASISCVRLWCVYLLRLCPASNLVRLCVLLCAAHSTPLHSFKHVKRVNFFKRPYASVLLVLFVSTHITPRAIQAFHPFQAFNSYNPLSNSIHSIPSICLPPHAFRRVKINFFKLMEKPTDSKCLTRFNSFGMFGVFGVVRSV